MSALLKKRIPIAFLFAVTLAAAENVIPLEPGNYWIYRSGAPKDEFTIRASVPVMHDGLVYYYLTGFASERLLVRNNERGQLVKLDEESGQEIVLVDPKHGASYETTRGGCRQSAETSVRGEEFRTLAGRFDQFFRVDYRSLGCADTGLTYEVYVNNIGLVKQEFTTFGGPRIYYLVEARVGKFTFAAEANVQSRLVLLDDQNSLSRRSAGDPLPLRVRLDLISIGALDMKLKFPTAQRVDLVLRDNAGRIVYQWSEGKFFAHVEGEELLDGRRSFVVDDEIESSRSIDIRDGFYTLESWLTTGNGPQFATSIKVEVFTRN